MPSFGRAFYFPPILVISVYSVMVVKFDLREATEKFDDVAFMSCLLDMSDRFRPPRDGGVEDMFS